MINFNTHIHYLKNEHGIVVARAGDRLVAHHGLYDHIGTLNYDGRVWACSRKYNGVRLVNYTDFAGGMKVSNHGNVGNLPPHTVLANYAALQGNGYSVFSKNCEQIDNYVRGLGYSSKQVLVAGVALLSVSLIVASAYNARTANKSA